ncbi:hypothetical protein [Bradyrhizobium sp. 604_D8_N2_3]|uniref:hypothetical protein n=1 Tax=Bradyrhizobium sp. 604_D8_N2_3 TaxID=3240370 RepID=UPI003F220470
MIGRELKLKHAQLMLRHRVKPVERAALPLLPATSSPQLIEGIASSSSIDTQRMAFVKNSLSWADLETIPLTLNHDSSKVVGRLLTLGYASDGTLRVRCEVRDEIARRQPAFSISATVIASTLHNEDSPTGFYFTIEAARLTELTLTTRHSCPDALVLSRRDVGASAASFDDIIARVRRMQRHLETFAVTPPPPPSSPPQFAIGAAPAHIMSRLPIAALKPHRSEFARLVATLPVGDAR